MSLMDHGKAQVQRCQNCVHRRPADGDGRIACNFPDDGMRGQLNAIVQGWWLYPWSFHPMWAITSCRHHAPREALDVA